MASPQSHASPSRAPPTTAVDIDAYVEKQRRLLQLERDSELAEDAAASADASALSALEASGSAITRLTLVGDAVDTGGRTTLKFATRGGRVLSAARLSTGDIVGVRAAQRRTAPSRASATSASPSGLPQGVLSLLGDTAVEVVMDDAELPPEFAPHGPGRDTFTLVRMASSVTFDRCISALAEVSRAASSTSHPAHALLGVLFRGRDPRFEDDVKLVLSPAQLTVLDGLNESQVAAVRHAMRCKDLCVVHGPPGTGKTSTLVAYIAAEVLRGSRVLVVAPSNIAVDNIAEKLAALSGKAKVNFVRTGHPARVMASVAKHTLDTILSQTDEAALARDVRAELAELQDMSGPSRRRGRAFVRTERKALRKELRKRESDAIKRLMSRVDCVLATVAGAGGSIVEKATMNGAFDVVVVDEAGQASEAAALVALVHGKKAVLAGDPFQLAPTVKSSVAQKEGLNRTLLDRVFSSPVLHDQVVKMLLCQYRMNKVISNWSSEALYSGRLVSSPQVAEHLLRELAPSREEDDGVVSENLEASFVLIDTAGCDFPESGEDVEDKLGGTTGSRYNEGEATVVVNHVHSLLRSGLLPNQVGVISPYAGQVRLLRSKFETCLFGDGLEVSTVDSFQGREKEAIVITLVRSNDRGNIGFVSDKRRLNVAITRARRHVCIVCDSTTVCRNEFISAMVDYASEFGDYRTADDTTSISAGQDLIDKLTVPLTDSNTNATSERRRSSGLEVSPICDERALGESGCEKNNHSANVLRQGETYGAPTLRSSSRPSETENGVGEIRSTLRAFSADDSTREMQFPPSLKSSERRAVHEICESMGLLHVTMGEESSRFITVRKALAATANASTLVVSEASKSDKSALDFSSTVARPARNGQFSVLQESTILGSEKTGAPTDGTSLGVTVGDPPETVVEQTTPSAPSAPGPANDVLRQANAARIRRKVELASSKAGSPTPNNPASGSNQSSGTYDTLPESTKRIIVDGRLMGGQKAAEAASTAAARARLKTKLSRQADARRSKKK